MTQKVECQCEGGGCAVICLVVIIFLLFSAFDPIVSWVNRDAVERGWATVNEKGDLEWKPAKEIKTKKPESTQPQGGGEAQGTENNE